ncbi:MAG: dethiobiotin synthase [Bacteroides sp. SM23_62_1]|nr:MAG: dethiobiotin synthase [Bacteroides sp. SM23_62_1]
MPRIFTVSEEEKTEGKEIRKDYFDRHSPVVVCEKTAKKGEKFRVKVRVGSEYSHPDDPDHYIHYVQLWNRETLLAEAIFPPGTLGNQKSQAEVDFYIILLLGMNLSAMSYCTKHGLWQSEPVEVKVI